MTNINNMLHFLDASPTAFQAIDNMTKMCLEKGFKELKENELFNLEKGGKYFITRNKTSFLAFKVGKELNEPSFNIAASHSDCPSFKVKPNGVISDKFSRLNTEVYGGPLYNPWLDRPLSLAGRIIIKEGNKIISKNFVLDEDFCIIPSVAIHMNRDANNGFKMNPQADLLPLVSDKKDFDIKAYLADKNDILKENLVGYDLYLYPRQKAYLWGHEKQFFSSFHIDNLECAYTTLVAFLESENEHNINVYACFDNEEVGSLTRQGADSDFLARNLKDIADSLSFSYSKALADSMLLSCDNAHASHPNHPEKDDPTNHTYMNQGVVVKYNANQSYTSDGLSAAIFTSLLDEHKIPYQYFTNRSDMRGGSTLGNISNGQVSLLSLDIGLPQLAMHSPLETAGVKDVESMIDAVKVFYSIHLKMLEDGTYQLLK